MKILQTKNITTLLWSISVGFVLLTSQLLASGIPMSAKIEIDGAGNAVAVWELQEGAVTVIQGAYCLASSGTWSAPQQLSPQSNSVSFMSKNPTLAINSAGNAAVIWMSVDPTTQISKICAATIALQNSPSWTSCTTISNPSESVGNIYIPSDYSVRVNESNQAIALWQSARFQVVISTSTVDGSNSWSTPVIVVDTN